MTEHRLPAWTRALSFSKLSGVYVWIALIVLFGVWIPEVFLTTSNLQNIAGSYAVTGIVTLGLLLPLAAGVFDLSIGFCVGSAAMLSTSLVSHGASPEIALLAALGLGVGVGCGNALLVVVFGIDSFIATLGTGSMLQALVYAISNGQQIIGLPHSFGTIGTAQPLGIPIPVIYLAVIAVVLWCVTEHTPFGRYLYAIGNGRDAARLAGVRTQLYTFGAMVIASVLAAFAGVVVSARVGAGSPDIAASYLLPAFAAAFLGATQIRNGRFNVIGSLVAIYLLATGSTGLQLVGASFWVTYLFNGAALVIAVGMSQIQGSSRTGVRRWWARKGEVSA